MILVSHLQAPALKDGAVTCASVLVSGEEKTVHRVIVEFLSHVQLVEARQWYYFFGGVGFSSVSFLQVFWFSFLFLTMCRISMISLVASRNKTKVLLFCQ